MSSLFCAKTVQIRSQNVEIQVAPAPLPPALPIGASEPHVQTDDPITFLHVHDCLELGYCFSGSGIFVVGEKVLTYQAGDMSFINSAEVHLAASAPGTQSNWRWIYLDPIRLIGHLEADVSRIDPAPLAGPAFNNILSPESHPEIGRILLRMISELDEKQAGVESSLRALTWELMILMRRIAPPLQDSRPRCDYERLAPALQMLTSGYANPLKIGDLARKCNLSEPHFRRLFVRTIGRSPHDYWNDLRLRMAASLLRSTGRSVLEISQDVGFETLSSFNRLFRTRFGDSPRNWRGKASRLSSNPTEDGFA